MKSENKNFLYNIVYQVLIYIFPLITTPYISRVLGVENIGIYSYTYSIVNMFMLIAMLGINNYGNRAVSRERDNKYQMSKKFCSIYYLQILMCFLVSMLYVVFIFFYGKEYKKIFFLQFINLISVYFDVNWFYFGIEKFKVTIVRNLIIKVLSTILIFSFVKTKYDLPVYVLIMACSTLFSQLYLVLMLKKYVRFLKVSFINIIANLKGCLLLFIPVLAYGIYRVMDKTMIGYISTVVELGYYENAEKIINIPIAIITALGTVMLPRMSYILRKDKNEYKNQIYESMKLGLLLSSIMFLGLILIGKDIAVVLFGDDFLTSGLIIKLLSATIIISSWANIIRTQYLIPIGEDKIYIISTAGGAIVNLVSNLIFIKYYGAKGACIGTILAEFFVMIYQTVKVKNQLEINKYLKLLIKYLLINSSIICFVWFFTIFIKNIYFRLIAKILLTFIIFFICFHQYILYDFFCIKRGKIDENKI